MPCGNHAEGADANGDDSERPMPVQERSGASKSADSDLAICLSRFILESLVDHEWGWMEEPGVEPES